MKVSLFKDLQKSTSKIEGYLDHADRKSIAHFLDKKTKVVQTLGSTKKLKPTEVHDFRKKIKEIYYLQKMLEKKGHRFARTDDFQELLGKWHDGRVLIQGIKDFIKADSLPQKDKLVFESLHQKIAAHNQQLYQSILSSKKAVLKNFK
jgi:CHAD domain-containing protein